MSEQPVSLWPQRLGYAPRPTGRAIIRTVAERHGLTEAQITTGGNWRRVSWPRQAAMYELRRRTTMSLPQIARFFGKDHTTVLHACRRHEQRLALAAIGEAVADALFAAQPEAHA